MNVLAVYSIKGGVGKTAFAVNFAYASALSGRRTLLFDLDPQGAASFCLRVQAAKKLKGRKLMAGRQPLGEFVRESDYASLDVLPAKESFRHFDISLADSGKPRRRLRRLLSPLADEYDTVILDSPPSLSLLSEAIIYAADMVAVPVVPTSLSANALDQLASFVKGHGWRGGPVLLPFLSMVERRKRMHRDIMEDLRSRYPSLLKTIIPYASDVERMGVTRAPLLATHASRPATRAFAMLAAEVLARIQAATGRK